ncbi:hypothetical protein ACFQ51_50205 [Streptomyces kaempferi]
MPLHLFATRSLATARLGRVLTSAVQASVLFLCSYYLQRTLGYSTLKSGFAFLPLGIVAILVTAPATRVMHRAYPRPVYLAAPPLPCWACSCSPRPPPTATTCCTCCPPCSSWAPPCSAAASPSTCTASPTSRPTSRASPPASWSPPSRSAPRWASPPSPPAP